LNFFFFAKIECGLYFLNRFDVLISKMIFKKWKNIIGMYFSTKSYLKSNRYHTAKHTLSRKRGQCQASLPRTSSPREKWKEKAWPNPSLDGLKELNVTKKPINDPAPYLCKWALTNRVKIHPFYFLNLTTILRGIIQLVRF